MYKSDQLELNSKMSATNSLMLGLETTGVTFETNNIARCQMDQIERRLLQGETIPTAEKVYSNFC